MEKERDFEDIVKAYLDAQVGPMFIVADLYKAVIAGCNEMTERQHENAAKWAEEYKRMKDEDLVYTLQDVEKAFRYGANKMAALVEETARQISIRNKQKAAKLISAGYHLMTIADCFTKEAEASLSVDNLVKTEIESKWKEIAQLFKEINEKHSRVFNNFTADEGYEWGEETEKIEYYVRKLMRIDEFEDYTKKNKKKNEKAIVFRGRVVCGM
jgi:hypothetical protein